MINHYHLFHAHPALQVPCLTVQYRLSYDTWLAIVLCALAGGVIPCHILPWACCVPARYFECTSRPLCKAKRNTARNGAVVELIAEAAAPPAAAAAAAAVAEDKDKRDAGDGDDGGIAASGVLDDEPDPTGITRYVLIYFTHSRPKVHDT